MNMDKLSLVALLDEDKEMVMASLARDPSLPAAQITLEKAIDRVMYRYSEACGDPVLLDSAQYILQAMKNTLPVMDSVGEARTWNRQAKAGKAGLNLGPMALALLVLGLVLVIAAVLGVLISGRFSGAPAFIKAMLPAALGCGALYWAGVQSARPGKRKQSEEATEDVRTEFITDGEKAWHCLRGAMLQADGQLEHIHEADALARQQTTQTGFGGKIDPKALDLFAELLETAYAAGDNSARESASAIRFYLHNAGVDVVDYVPGRESWFEFLPAAGAGTMRPALASEGKLIKKGLASKQTRV